MLQKSVTICNQKGLHARASAKLVEVVSQFKAVIEIERNGNIVSALSIMGLLTLAASHDTEIIIRSEGIEAKAALEAVIKLVEDKFGELY